MITIEQIKAGRALLGWSQQELAEKAGYALPTLNNLERGASVPRAQTITDICQAMEKAGVQFLEQTGVRLVKEPLDIKMLEGPDCLKILYDDLFSYADPNGAELLLSNIEEDRFLGFDKYTMYDYIKKTGNRPDIHHKLLFRHGDTKVLGPNVFGDIAKERNEPAPIAAYSEWRWLPENLFGLVPMIVYGDKYATILWGDHVRIVITQNASIAETFRKQFMAFWEIADRIPEDQMPKW